MVAYFSSAFANLRKCMSTLINLDLFIPSILFLSLGTGCLQNPYIDGPDVISRERAGEKFRAALAAVLYPVDSEAALLFAVPRSPSDAIDLCARNQFYYKDSVDYCEQAILSIRGPDSDSILLQYAITMEAICDLKTANIFRSEKPLQGEINICSAIGAQ